VLAGGDEADEDSQILTTTYCLQRSTVALVNAMVVDRY
jgi:hypothetical protein